MKVIRFYYYLNGTFALAITQPLNKSRQKLHSFFQIACDGDADFSKRIYTPQSAGEDDVDVVGHFTDGKPFLMSSSWDKGAISKQQPSPDNCIAGMVMMVVWRQL